MYKCVNVLDLLMTVIVFVNRCIFAGEKFILTKIHSCAGCNIEIHKDLINKLIKYDKM